MKWHVAETGARRGMPVIRDETGRTICTFPWQNVDRYRHAEEIAMAHNAMQPPAGETTQTTQDGSMEAASVTGQSPADAASPDAEALRSLQQAILQSSSIADFTSVKKTVQMMQDATVEGAP